MREIIAAKEEKYKACFYEEYFYTPSEIEEIARCKWRVE